MVSLPKGLGEFELIGVWLPCRRKPYGKFLVAHTLLSEVHSCSMAEQKSASGSGNLEGKTYSLHQRR